MFAKCTCNRVCTCTCTCTCNRVHVCTCTCMYLFNCIDDASFTQSTKRTSFHVWFRTNIVTSSTTLYHCILTRTILKREREGGRERGREGGREREREGGRERERVEREILSCICKNKMAIHINI